MSGNTYCRRCNGYQSDLKLPACTDTKKMMDYENISVIDFMNRFKQFKIDEISFDKAEDDM